MFTQLFFGRQIPVVRTKEGIRAVSEGEAIKPESVERYLQSKFGQALPEARNAMEELAKSLAPKELSKQAYAIYGQFTPKVPAGDPRVGSQRRIGSRQDTNAGKGDKLTSARRAAAFPVFPLHSERERQLRFRRSPSSSSISMRIESIAGAVLITGSALFLIAAGLPISRVFVERLPANRLRLLQDHPVAWKIAQGLFSLGASIATLGLVLVAVRPRVKGGWWAWIGAVLALLGAILWDWHVLLRARQPVEFVKGSLPAWQFPAYSLLTQFALVALRISLLQSAHPTWLGWVSMGYPLLLFLGYLAFKDMPPFTYYLLTLVIGLVMVL